MSISLIIVIAALVALLALFLKVRELKAWTLAQQKQIDELKRKVALLSEQSVAGKEDNGLDAEYLCEKDKAVPDLANVEDMPPVSPPPIPPVPVVPPVPPKEKVVSASKNQDALEEKIGVNLLSKIGIMVLIIGIGFFVKYAIDNNWINEVGRTVLGLCAGFALWGIGIRLRDTYRNFSSVLSGGGFAVNFVTVAIAYNYYNLFPSWFAFGILVLLTAIMTAAAIKWNRRELASVAVVGGFVAPFLASGETGSFVTLCSYVLILNVGMSVLAVRKNWVEIPLAAMCLTYIVVAEVYANVKMNVSLSASAFVTVYFLIYLPVLIELLKRNSIKGMLMTLFVCALLINDFAYFAEALTFFGDDPLKGAVPLVIALANALAYALMLRNVDNRALRELVSGTACVSVLLFVPVQFSEATVVIICLSIAMVALFKAYSLFRMDSFVVVGVSLGVVLGVALFIGWCLDLLAPAVTWTIGSYILSGACYIVTAFVIESFRNVNPESKIGKKIMLYADRGFVAAFWVGALTVLGGFYLLFYSSFHWAIALRAAVVLMMVEMLLIKPVHRNGADAGWMFPGIGVLAYGLQLDYFTSGFPILFLTAVSTLLLAALIIWQFYIERNDKDRSGLFAGETRSACIVYANLCAVGYIVFAVMLWLQIFGCEGWWSAGFSISLTLTAAVQMIAGMRLHDKTTRVMSLLSFVAVLLKLVVNDMWEMPSVSRIIIFILLGITLLAVSFLYQRLKTALFSDDDDKARKAR